jgi:hypothetical protein
MIIIDNVLIGVLCFLNFTSFVLCSATIIFFFFLFVKNHNALKENIQKMNELNERLDKLNKVNNYVVEERHASMPK